MLQNQTISDWMKEIRNNTFNTMRISAEKKLNKDSYHLSKEAKKRLVWLYILIYEKKGNVSQTAIKVGISRQWMSKLKDVFERHNKDPRCLEPKSRSPENCSNRVRISKEKEDLIIKIRDTAENVWGKEKIAWVLNTTYGIKINHNTVNKYLHKHKRIDPKISLRNKKALEEKKHRKQENILLKANHR